jgi:hypothetical protein
VLVIALGLVLIAAACAVVLSEATKSVLPLVGPAAIASPRPIPAQRSSIEFTTALPTEASPLRATP